MIFNEKVMYKDRSGVETDMADSDTSPQKSEFIRLEGLPDVTEQNKTRESLQEDSSTSVPTTTQEDAEPSEPIVYVRRSSRTVKPPQRFTLLLNYILLTDGGEPLILIQCSLNHAGRFPITQLTNLIFRVTSKIGTIPLSFATQLYAPRPS